MRAFYKDQALYSNKAQLQPECNTRHYFYHICTPDGCIGSLEFIASQVPYYMKGVLQILGVGCQSLAISGTINDMSILVGPFQRKLSTWGTKLISCLFWYALNYAQQLLQVLSMHW